MSQSNPLDPGPHSHHFISDTSVSERRTFIVIAITATMMVVEIAAGLAYHSMSLLADGWHMSTHVAAFLITALAYRFCRRHATDPTYSFGTGKMGVLGGFTSAVILAMVALLMAGESAHRMFDPQPIRFSEAIAVACVGLMVNLVCALLLKDDHHHHLHGHHHHGSHDHDHPHDSPVPDTDLNRRAAYLHVLADALTSVTAIVALLSGKYFGWSWLDPMMGIVGSVIVAIWAYGLLRDTSGILLDRTPESTDLPLEIRKTVEADGQSSLTDLHVWQLAPGKFSAILSIASTSSLAAEHYRDILREHEELVHVTIEINSL